MIFGFIREELEDMLEGLKRNDDLNSEEKVGQFIHRNFNCRTGKKEPVTDTY